jgi:D-serine deaminase-like pyridoxal phosphate-dependent protein
MQLADLETPALLLDREKLVANIERMRAHLAALGVALRPHVKTAKCIEVVHAALEGQPGGITVSTLKEAEYFHGHGIDDILYAVGIAPNKLAHVMRLIEGGARLSLITDNAAAVTQCDEAARAAGLRLPVLIELDVDGHRSGIVPDSAGLLELAACIDGLPGLELAGVMTHAGDSYNCRSEEELVAFAERERSGAVHAADRLAEAGLPCPAVSVGSTPTATFARDLTGVTEVRAGVYMFHDLVMAGLGVCRNGDIALSVLVCVIGHQPERGWIITDGGWTALSRDRGTASQAVDQGYGLVRDLKGAPLEDDLIVQGTNQEHGIVARRDGAPLDPARYPVGTLLRVLPNHACATGTQYSAYHVVEGTSPEIRATWSRFSGW